ncbi:MAG: hypothetical protein K0S14_31 [Thermomicrobiales bacterium]|jgi:hypothetical protein|nr:hypothetical protein [Thermomicrobiales bacterium]
MAITNYTELQTAVGNWLGRTDLTSRLPEFIALAEPKIRRELRDRTERAEITVTADSLSHALASDVKEVRSLAFSDANHIYPLRQVTPAQLARISRTGTGRPVAFAVLDGSIYFDVAPDAAYEFVLTYLEKITPLSGSATTNTVLTNSPDIYLYGTLVEAEPYLEHDERIATWQAMFSAAIASENNYRERQELGASPEMDLPVVFGEDDGY